MTPYLNTCAHYATCKRDIEDGSGDDGRFGAEAVGSARVLIFYSPFPGARTTPVVRVNFYLCHQYDIVNYILGKYKITRMNLFSPAGGIIDVKRRNWLHSCDKSFRQVIDY